MAIAWFCKTIYTFSTGMLLLLLCVFPPSELSMGILRTEAMFVNKLLGKCVKWFKYYFFLHNTSISFPFSFVPHTLESTAAGTDARLWQKWNVQERYLLMCPDALLMCPDVIQGYVKAICMTSIFCWVTELMLPLSSEGMANGELGKQWVLQVALTGERVSVCLRMMLLFCQKMI